MAQGFWIEPISHWKAYGDIQSDGSMKKATVDDNNGTTRTRDKDFSSKDDFFSWIKRQ
ncbi:hypothetical protein V3C41_01560 [Paenarthrobacter nicotinovorans]|uniref:Uncharacterized protein n=1 Tax=Paenarthrobacter nicotinovorans TaxID=29320 RepID=A0ABV0GMG8_PAENI